VQKSPLSGKARVLVMVEQPLIADVIAFTLNHGVYLTRKALNLDEATVVLDEWHPHLAVIDMDIGGERLVQRLDHVSEGGARIPTLALTRRGDLRTKLAAFEQGVDDIMTIPFSPEELLARVLAITRRSYGQAIQIDPVIRLGDIEIDIMQRQVRAGTSEIHLTGLEQSLLYLLVAHAGQIVTRDEILDSLWGVDYVSESNIVDRHVRNLRAKLQNDWRKPRFIATVPGKGYKFIPTFKDPVQTPEPGQAGPRAPGVGATAVTTPAGSSGADPGAAEALPSSVADR